jgi:hypothetical protein
MNILEQKVEELDKLSNRKLVYRKFVSNENSYALANKEKKKIVVLIADKEQTYIKSYSVDLENWLDAESKGINSEDIIKGLSVLRAFGVRTGQRFISQGDIFQEINLDDVESHLEIID